MSLIDGLTRITVAPDQRYSDYTRGEADIMGAYSFKVSLRYIIFTIQINAHIQLCEGTRFERRGLDLTDWRGLLDFWRRMKIKMAAVT